MGLPKFVHKEKLYYFCMTKNQILDSMAILEVCCGNLASVEAAVWGGAERIELCSALSLGGVTPSIGLLQHVRNRFPDLRVHPLIRLREGSFVYTAHEVEVMVRDIEAALPWCDGIVCGALTPDGDIDVPAMRRMMDAAHGLPVTFHRAIDRCRDPFTALEQIIDMGCKRILTSGHQPQAQQGVDLLRRLNEQAAGRIIIMPGGGVTIDNARTILDHTGCHEIHASCSSGTGITDPAAVHQILQALS